MRFASCLFLALTASVPVYGHFNLLYPESRGVNHETQTTAPCGGKNSFSSTRELFNPDGSPIVTSSSHTQSGVQVMFCPSTSDCSTNANFNITLIDAFFETGAGNFCLANVTIPDSLYPSTRKSALNGTIQVIYYSDDGELYNCADVSITLEGSESSSLCTNATGIASYPWEGSLADSAAAAGVSDASASSTTIAASTATSSTSSGNVVAVSGLLAFVMSTLAVVAV